MKRFKILTTPALLVVALTLVAVGCNREVSSESQKTVRSDGSTVTKEKKVTESSDGTVTKEQSSKTTPPTKP